MAVMLCDLPSPCHVSQVLNVALEGAELDHRIILDTCYTYGTIDWRPDNTIDATIA